MKLALALIIIHGAVALWLARRHRRRRAAAAGPVDTPEPERTAIVVPTCAQCGAIVWENRTHGHRFCEQGHEDPDITFQEIDEIHLADHNAQGDPDA